MATSVKAATWTKVAAVMVALTVIVVLAMLLHGGHANLEQQARAICRVPPGAQLIDVRGDATIRTYYFEDRMTTFVLRGGKFVPNGEGCPS